MSEWQDAPLGKVATLQRGFDLPARSRRPGRVPIVSSSGVSGWHDRAMVKAPGVVTGRYGTIGEVFFEEIDFWPLNTTLWVSNYHGNDQRFVYYLLQRIDYATHSGKSGVPGVNRNDLHGELVQIPASVAEQRSISEVLRDIDALVSSLERVIAKKRAIKQGMMQELLAGRMRLPGFNARWRDTTLGEVSSIKTGSRNSQDRVEGGRYPFFIRSASVERIDTYSYDCEAILVPGEGGIGSIFHYIDGKFEVHQRVYKISDFRGVVGKFAYHYMRQFFGPYAMENSVKATVDSLRLPTLNSFEMTVPTDLHEQRSIVGVLDDADAEIAVLERRLGTSRAIKQGMMQELLTGRTRLRNDEEVAA